MGLDEVRWPVFSGPGIMGLCSNLGSYGSGGLLHGSAACAARWESSTVGPTGMGGGFAGWHRLLEHR